LSTDSQLTKLDKARAELAQCRTLSDVKKIRDSAEAYRTYARAAHVSREASNYAAEIRLLAEHRAGEVLRQLERGKPGPKGKLSPSIGDNSEYARALAETNTPSSTARYWQKVAELPKTAIEKYVRKVNETDGAEITTRGLFSFHSSNVTQLTSDSNEWYTAEKYIESARLVLGNIDLDPASCPAANKVVSAARFFSLEEDGLQREWSGRLWLNPPWGDVGPRFVDKLLESFQAGSVPAAVLLVNSHATDARWFQPLWDFSLCFTSPRIRYWQSDSERQRPNSGSVFVYFGPERRAFANEFSKYGAIVEKVRL
jgi:hypothetical protein